MTQLQSVKTELEDLRVTNAALKQNNDELKTFFNNEHERSANEIKRLQQANDDLCQSLVNGIV